MLTCLWDLVNSHILIGMREILKSTQKSSLWEITIKKENSFTIDTVKTEYSKDSSFTSIISLQFHQSSLREFHLLDTCMHHKQDCEALRDCD